MSESGNLFLNLIIYSVENSWYFCSTYYMYLKFVPKTSPKKNSPPSLVSHIAIIL